MSDRNPQAQTAEPRDADGCHDVLRDEFPAWLRVVGFTYAGLAVGLFLTLSGLLAIETGGYGTPFFLLVYSSPTGLLGKGPLVLVCSVLLWTLMGVLLGTVSHAMSRTILRLLLLVHYSAIPFVLMLHWDNHLFGWSNFRVAFEAGGPILITTIGIYLFAEFCLLRGVIKGREWPGPK